MARLSLQRALAKARKTGVTGGKNSSRDSFESETELCGGGGGVGVEEREIPLERRKEST